jgi:dCMP deaminase
MTIPVQEYYLRIAHATSLRSSCERAKVGCIIVTPNGTMFTGYNGSLSGQPHCDKETCTFKGNCIRTIHAEMNAIERATRAGYNKESLRGSAVYVTHHPCYSCAKALSAWGLDYIIYNKDYDDEKAKAYVELSNMHVFQVKLPID